jgi:DNA-binding winged helix-turn-helix (wHTH) protein
MTFSSGDVYEFGLCRLDTGQRILRRENQRVPLTPKMFDLLLLLVRSPGKAFSKQELMAAVWPDSYVPSSEHRETGGNQSGVVP